MADSYLLKSQEYAAPFQKMQADANQQAYAAPVQAGLQAFLAMQDNVRRNRENAAAVAMEEAKRQDYMARLQALNMELDTRIKMQGLQVAKMQAEAQRAQLQAANDYWNIPDGMFGQPIELNGELIKMLPGQGGAAPHVVPVTGDEKEAFLQRRRAGTVSARLDEERLRRAEYENSPAYRAQQEQWIKSRTNYNESRAGTDIGMDAPPQQQPAPSAPAPRQQTSPKVTALMDLRDASPNGWRAGLSQEMRGALTAIEQDRAIGADAAHEFFANMAEHASRTGFSSTKAIELLLRRASTPDGLAELKRMIRSNQR